MPDQIVQETTAPAVTAPPPRTKEDMKLTELRQLAKEHKVPNWYRVYNKKKLIKALERQGVVIA